MNTFISVIVVHVENNACWVSGEFQSTQKFI